MVLVKAEAEIIRKQMQEKIGREGQFKLIFRKNGTVEIALFYDSIEQHIMIGVFMGVLDIMNKHELNSMMFKKKIIFYRN